jgi:hypothetical protein
LFSSRTGAPRGRGSCRQPPSPPWSLRLTTIWRFTSPFQLVAGFRAPWHPASEAGLWTGAARGSLLMRLARQLTQCLETEDLRGGVDSQDGSPGMHCFFPKVFFFRRLSLSARQRSARPKKPRTRPSRAPCARGVHAPTTGAKFFLGGPSLAAHHPAAWCTMQIG